MVIDGAKALQRAVAEVFGRRALIRRCREHKKRNVTDALPERLRAGVRSALESETRNGNSESNRRSCYSIPMRAHRWIALVLMVLAFTRVADAAAAGGRKTIAGTANDALGRPLPDVVVRLKALGLKTRTDARGHFQFNPVSPGTYVLTAAKAGFHDLVIAVDLRAKGSAPLTLTLVSTQPLTVAVVAQRLNQARNALSPETGSSVYRFDRQALERLPQGEDTPLRQMLIQAPGVSQDAYGQGQEQIHVHGENGGGIQYRINGIFIPEAVSSFGEIMSPRFVKSVDLITGFMPAQFGYRNEGIIDIHTVEGCGNAGGSVEFYGGQRGTLQPSFEYAGCKGNLSYYVGGFYLQNDLGEQPATPTPTPPHDRTNQGQLFGYFSYLLGPSARLSLISGNSVNAFQIPPNPDVTPAFELSGVPSFPPNNVAERELEQNYFAILALQGSVGTKLDYQAAYFTRYYQLNFNPDPAGDLIYNGIAARLLQSGFINGIQTDTSYRFNPAHTFRAGIYVSGEAIESDDHAMVFPANPDGSQSSTIPEPVIDNHNTKALLFGAYVQDEWHPTRKLTLINGVRFDLMDAYLTQRQFSPRVGATYQLTPQTDLHAGYARYFQVPPFESVLFGTVSRFAGTTGEPSVTSGNPNVKAEQDNYFDAGVTQKLAPQLSLSLDSFFLIAHDKLDLAQFGSTYVFAPLSYRQGRSWGVDFSLLKSGAALSSYFNFSYAVLQAKEITAGQFLADDSAELAYAANHWITTDDDQMFTASAGASYRWRGWLLMMDSIWGSGYRRGFANTGELPPILQFDVAVARSFELPRVGQVTGRISVVNLFDHRYEIRNGTGIGVFSPQWGPRRAVYVGLRIPLPAISGTGAQAH